MYDQRGDPYTFSVLLHGPPGCGKTSLLKALINFDAQQRGIVSHLFVVPFSKISSIEMFSHAMLDDIVNRSKIEHNRRIYVFEDFDANESADVFNIRKSLKQAQNIKKKQEKLQNQSVESKDEIKEDFVDELKSWWTTEVGLSQYLDGCIDAGYENIKFIHALQGNEDRMNAFIQAIGVEKAGHSMMIKQKLIALNEQMLKQMEIEQEMEQEMVELDEQSNEDLKKSKFSEWKMLKNIMTKKMNINSGGGDDSSSWSGLVKDKLNLSDILNILDGIVERTGQRCVWTTNKAPPQKYFDPAFLRPGRMDMIIKLGCCTVDGIEYLLRNYYQVDHQMDEDDAYEMKYNLTGIEEGRFTPAQIKQICKENMDVMDAIAMLRQLCHPEDDVADGKEDKDTLKMPMDQITRSHSGHWFDKTLDVKDDTKLVDVPSKMQQILKAR